MVKTNQLIIDTYNVNVSLLGTEYTIDPKNTDLPQLRPILNGSEWTEEIENI